MIYLDSCLVIYLVEDHVICAPLIKNHVLRAVPAKFAISPLVMSEVLVMPLREKNSQLIERYDAFFESCILLPIPEVVFITKAHLRATHLGLKTPDALHLATAQHHDCTSFWTNDERLQKNIGGYAINVCQ